MSIERQLEALNDELTGKPQGYVTTLPLTDKALPGGESPEAEIILLDPDDLTLAFRRTSDMISGDERGEWYIGSIDDLFEEMLNWEDELETLEDPDEDPDSEDYEE
jgi:hypothetical protein